MKILLDLHTLGLKKYLLTQLSMEVVVYGNPRTSSDMELALLLAELMLTLFRSISVWERRCGSKAHTIPECITEDCAA